MVNECLGRHLNECLGGHHDASDCILLYSLCIRMILDKSNKIIIMVGDLNMRAVMFLDLLWCPLLSTSIESHVPR